MKLQIAYLKADEITPYINNTRTHSKEQIEQIKASINEFGMCTPIGLHNGTIVYGHARFTALKELGHTEFPTIDLSHLSEVQKKAYIIADNKLALNAGWDEDLLKLEIEDLSEMDFDIDLLGFDSDELDLIIDIDETVEGLTDEDEVPEIQDDPISKRGDVWILGNHRLMCGDSTSIDDVEKLMDGEKADFGFCDPPYNLGFEYNSYDDNKSDNEYIEFSKLWFSSLQLFTERQAVTLGTKNINVMALLGEFAGVACWVKKNWITSCVIAKLQQWEPIFFYGDFTKLKRTSDLFEINRKIQKDIGSDHTCPKQIDLIVDIYDNYSIKSVLDLFMGSGTSIISCEKISRICYGMELDEKYIDVIINRWQNFTGKEATLESTGETYNSMKPNG